MPGIFDVVTNPEQFAQDKQRAMQKATDLWNKKGKGPAATQPPPAQFTSNPNPGFAPMGGDQRRSLLQAMLARSRGGGGGMPPTMPGA